ncbi:MAG: lamin tail domain-containing protein, partial [Chloroflexi bacterium]|nr:lamin tail domain-containing protein [Chloroflexota bacterium]
MRVIDGDTLVVRINGTEHTVRLLGIDAPEPGDRGGQAALAEQAAAALVALVGDGAITLIAGGEPSDDGGRLLRHVARANLVFSVELARQGWVRAHEYTPNTPLFGEIAEAQREARAAARGLWAPPVPGLAMAVDKVAETVVIANDGGAPVDLSGWRVASLRGPQSVELPAGTVLQAGSSLTVASGSSQGDVAFGQRHVWHNELPDSAAARRNIVVGAAFDRRIGIEGPAL